jgi:hypothetical protein
LTTAFRRTALTADPSAARSATKRSGSESEASALSVNRSASDHAAPARKSAGHKRFAATVSKTLSAVVRPPSGTRTVRSNLSPEPHTGSDGVRALSPSETLLRRL